MRNDLIDLLVSVERFYSATRWRKFVALCCLRIWNREHRNRKRVFRRTMQTSYKWVSLARSHLSRAYFCPKRFFFGPHLHWCRIIARGLIASNSVRQNCR